MSDHLQILLLFYSQTNNFQKSQTQFKLRNETRKQIEFAPDKDLSFKIIIPKLLLTSSPLILLFEEMLKQLKRQGESSSTKLEETEGTVKFK